MRATSHILALKSLAAVVAVLVLLESARSQTSDDELRLGTEAYKKSRYEEAIHHFRKAVELDSNNLRAHMYLATTCANQYIPGVDTTDNLASAKEAITQYEFVLDSGENEQRINSAKGIAYLYVNMNRFDEAKDYYEKAISFDLNDPEPHHSIGAIDWTVSYTARMKARSRLNLKPEEQLNPEKPEQKKACDDLNAKYKSTVEQGMASLEKALQLKPDYDDAMAYLNLMYRERADLECDDPAARRLDLEKAEEWVDRTLAVKKQKAENDRSTASNPQ